MRKVADTPDGGWRSMTVVTSTKPMKPMKDQVRKGAGFWRRGVAAAAAVGLTGSAVVSQSSAAAEGFIPDPVELPLDELPDVQLPSVTLDSPYPDAGLTLSSVVFYDRCFSYRGVPDGDYVYANPSGGHVWRALPFRSRFWNELQVRGEPVEVINHQGNASTNGKPYECGYALAQAATKTGTTTGAFFYEGCQHATVNGKNGVEKGYDCTYYGMSSNMQGEYRPVYSRPNGSNKFYVDAFWRWSRSQLNATQCVWSFFKRNSVGIASACPNT